MSSNDGSSSGAEGSSSDEPPGSQPCQRKPRTASKWPSDKIIVTGISADGYPTDKKARQRMRRLAGLVARERIPLTVDCISEISKKEREDIFEKCIQSKLEFPEDMKESAFKKAWVMIGKLRRNFRSSLATQFVAKGLEPFKKHKFLSHEDWSRFSNLQSTQEAIAKSLKGKELRSKNKLDHRLGPTGYDGAIPKWDAQDAKLEAEGKPNPWKAYPGRSHPFMRARGTLTEGGEISFTSNETEQLSHRILEKAAASSEGSVTGVRENDILTEALGNPEHRGRVRGVSSYSGWRSWPQCQDMYKKRKKTQMDMGRIGDMVEDMVEEKMAKERAIMQEDFKQQMVAMLAAHGLAPIPPSPAAERFNSEASVGVLEPTLHPLDSDMIGSLDEPMSCILQIVRGDTCINVARGQVLPNVTILHTVEVDRSKYAVVHVDWVDDEYYDEPVPVPNDEISTMRDALLQRLLWERSHILCKKPAASSKAMEKKNEKQKVQVPVAAKKQIVPCASKKGESKEKIASSSKGKHDTKEAKRQKNSKSNEVAPIWTSANQKFKLGEPIVSTDELQLLGGQALHLHNYYMRSCREKKNSITLHVKPHYFLKGCDDYIVVNFSDLYDLYHHSGLDMSLIRVYTLSLIRESRMTKKPVAFLDPNPLSSTQLKAGGDAKKEVTTYLLKALSHFQATSKKYVMFAYNTIGRQGSSHWVLVVIVMTLKQVWYLNSLRHVKADYTDLRKVIDQAFGAFQNQQQMKKEKLTHMTDFECHQQEVDDACGFYCCHHMSAIMAKSDKKPEAIKLASSPLTSQDFDMITQTVALCLMDDTIRSNGEFSCQANN